MKLLVKKLPLFPWSQAAPSFGGEAAEQHAPRTLVDSHRFPAWLLSCLLHAGLLVGLGLMIRAADHRGGDLPPARGGGIVLAQDADGKAEYFDRESTAASGTGPSSAAEALPHADALPVDIPGGLPEPAASPSGSESGLTLAGADGLTQGGTASGRGAPQGDQAHTSVFGAEGVGTKFVYVFDRSASMEGYQGRPLRAAKRELTASLSDLERVHQFQIVFYNDDTTVFNPSHPRPPRMLFGDKPTKRQAGDFLQGIIGTGGTKHVPALKLALGMRPDVVFFLTDAAESQLSQAQLADIRQANNRVGATIHAIEFGAGRQRSHKPLLQQLAKQNGGTYVYVNATRLKLK